MHYKEAVELNRKLETIQTSFTLNEKTTSLVERFAIIFLYLI